MANKQSGCTGCGCCLVILATVIWVVGQHLNSLPITSSDNSSASSADKQSNVRVINLPHYGKREVCVVDKVAYCIAKVTKTSTIGNSYTATDADGQFVIIRLMADNEDTTTHEVTTSLITLNDSNNREYSPSSSGDAALVMSGDKDAEIALAELQPSVVKMISIVYDIPKGDKGLKLKIPHGVLSFGQDGTITVP